MKRKQIIIVLILLAVPIFVVLFLYTFGKNKYTIPVFYENGMQGVANCPSTPGPHSIPDFDLTSQNSAQVSQHMLEGKISVVNFFETHCDNNCAQIAAALASVQDNFANKPKVQILSISTRNNNTAELIQFGNEYYSKPEKWHLLTGNSDQVAQLARCGFGLSEMNCTPYPISRVVLIDEEKKIRGYYDLTNDEETDRLIIEIRILLYDTQ